MRFSPPTEVEVPAAQRLGSGQSDHGDEQGGQRPNQQTVHAIAKFDVVRSGRRRPRAQQAGHVTPQSVGRERGEDHIEPGQHNEGNRGIPPRRCGRADSEPDRQSKGMQHQCERRRGDCARDDQPPLRMHDSLSQGLRAWIQRFWM